MAEQRTALQGLCSAVANPAHLLVERPVAGAWVLSGWDRDIVDEARIAARILLAEEIPEPGWAVSTETALLAPLAPWRYLVITSDVVVAKVLASALAPATRIDCRCARSWLRLSGTQARGLLDAKVAVDLRAGVSQTGNLVQTVLGHMDVIIHERSNDEFDVLVGRSYARSLNEYLGTALYEG